MAKYDPGKTISDGHEIRTVVAVVDDQQARYLLEGSDGSRILLLARAVDEQWSEVRRRLCAHADGGHPMHWLEPGEKCRYLDEPAGDFDCCRQPVTEQQVSRGLYLATTVAAVDFLKTDIEALQEYARQEHAERAALERELAATRAVARGGTMGFLLTQRERDALHATIERVRTYVMGGMAKPPELREHGAKILRLLDSQPPAGQKTACASCGEPFSPNHDAAAPGPTLRHPYKPTSIGEPT